MNSSVRHFTLLFPSAAIFHEFPLGPSRAHRASTDEHRLNRAAAPAPHPDWPRATSPGDREIIPGASLRCTPARRVAGTLAIRRRPARLPRSQGQSTPPAATGAKSTSSHRRSVEAAEARASGPGSARHAPPPRGWPAAADRRAGGAIDRHQARRPQQYFGRRRMIPARRRPNEQTPHGSTATPRQSYPPTRPRRSLHRKARTPPVEDIAYGQ